MSKKPNIFLFVGDQMRSDSLHHLGNSASITPNFDSLAEEGVSFKNAYCQNPVCTPSRCSFLSGLYPHTSGHRTMHFLQAPDEPNILRTMKENGYEVIWIGRNDVIPGSRSKEEYCDEYYNGFSFEDTKSVLNQSPFQGAGKHSLAPKEANIHDDNYYSFYIGKSDAEPGFSSYDWNCLKSALDYLDRKSKEPDGKPFFVYVTVIFPHPPYMCEDPWFSSIDRNNLEKRRPDVKTLKDKASMLYEISKKQNLGGWTEERFNELRATYLAMVSRLDHQYGLLRDKLKETGFYDSTSVFVYSDHGDFTGDFNIVEKAQNCFENPLSNVPLLVKPAKEFSTKPRISEALVELLDLPATIADMAGIQLPYTQFGKSLLDAISGNETHKDAVFCEGGRIHGETQAMELGHTEQSIYWPRLSTQYSEGPEHTKATMIRMGNLKYTMRLYEKCELYDLNTDPYELNNLIDHPDYQEEVKKFKERLLIYFMETGDYVPNRRDPR